MENFTYRNYTVEKKSENFYMIINPLDACDSVVYHERDIKPEIDRLIREYGEWVKVKK